MNQHRNKPSLKFYPHNPAGISRQLAAICLIFSLLLLGACGTPTVKNQSQPLDSQASNAFQLGNFSTAADLWQQLAEQSNAANRSYYLLRAADARLMNRQADQAETLISQVDPQQLDHRYRALYNAVNGELLLKQGKPVEAETLLGGTSTTNSELQKRVQLLLDKARLQQLSPELQAWGEFEQRAESTFMSDEDALALLHLLDPVSVTTLKDQSSRRHGEIPGWIDLALIARNQYPDEDTRMAAIASWRTSHPFHRLDGTQAYQLATEFNASLAVPGRISILLPQNGRMAALATAIRDGLMSSYLNSPQKNRSELRFISTTDTSLSLGLGRVTETSDQIIGPLDRLEVSSVIRSVPADFPILALNLPRDESTASIQPADSITETTDKGQAETRSIPTVRLVDDSRSQRNPNAVFFPLLPEDEARAAARLAISMRALKMVIIAPDSHLGNRQVDAFTSEYYSAGGQVIASMRFAEKDVDHSARLKQILGVTQSQQRGNELQRLLGGELGFEASVRGDLDAIFLVASPRQGRLIKPQLKFLDAGYLPVFATGMIYSGVPDWSADRDLDGIRVTSNRMALKRVLSLTQENVEEKTETPGTGRYDRFTAMGADSWSILPWLPMLMANPRMSYSGLSGELTIDADGRLKREPVWAYFSNGRLTALPTDK